MIFNTAKPTEMLIFHIPGICKIRVKLWKLKRTKVAAKMQYDRHCNIPNVKEKYTDNVKCK